VSKRRRAPRDPEGAKQAPGSHVAGRTVEVELISGVELGDWRDRVLVPHDVPCFVTAEEQIACGGNNSASQATAAKPPDGITHHYVSLAVVAPAENGTVSEATPCLEFLPT
jgi:hypothetical protein